MTTKRRGLASMSEEDRKRIASLGGKACKHREFKDPVGNGRKGGQAVPAEKRMFARDPALAKRASDAAVAKRRTRPLLSNWAMFMFGGAYKAPEQQQRVLVGDVYGSSRFADGERITTSRLVAVKGRCVRTVNGTTYRLGYPQLGYLEWMRENGVAFNAKQPIVVHDGLPWQKDW